MLIQTFLILFCKCFGYRKRIEAIAEVHKLTFVIEFVEHGEYRSDWLICSPDDGLPVTSGHYQVPRFRDIFGNHFLKFNQVIQVFKEFLDIIGPVEDSSERDLGLPHHFPNAIFVQHRKDIANIPPVKGIVHFLYFLGMMNQYFHKIIFKIKNQIPAIFKGRSMKKWTEDLLKSVRH